MPDESGIPLTESASCPHGSKDVEHVFNVLVGWRDSGTPSNAGRRGDEHDGIVLHVVGYVFTPKELCLIAQGCRASRLPWVRDLHRTYPERVAALTHDADATPLG